jgi:hypothetical protein
VDENENDCGGQKRGKRYALVFNRHAWLHFSTKN